MPGYGRGRLPSVAWCGRHAAWLLSAVMVGVVSCRDHVEQKPAPAPLPSASDGTVDFDFSAPLRAVLAVPVEPAPTQLPTTPLVIQRRRYAPDATGTERLIEIPIATPTALLQPGPGHSVVLALYDARVRCEDDAKRLVRHTRAQVRMVPLRLGHPEAGFQSVDANCGQRVGLGEPASRVRAARSATDGGAEFAVQVDLKLMCSAKAIEPMLELHGETRASWCGADVTPAPPPKPELGWLELAAGRLPFTASTLRVDGAKPLVLQLEAGEDLRLHVQFDPDHGQIQTLTASGPWTRRHGSATNARAHWVHVQGNPHRDPEVRIRLDGTFELGGGATFELRGAVTARVLRAPGSDASGGRSPTTEHGRGSPLGVKQRP